METRTKKQIVLKKQKCGGFLFKIFEPKMSIQSTNVALAGNTKTTTTRHNARKRKSTRGQAAREAASLGRLGLEAACHSPRSTARQALPFA